MRFAQIVVTDEQAELISAALNDAAGNEDLHEDDAKQIGRLQLMFQDVTETPAKYPVTGKMAGTVRSIVRRAKGAAQPKPLNTRKARQEQRMRTAKERRRLRRQIAGSYNAAVEIMEQEQLEAEAARKEAEERFAKQPKYRVLTGDGNVLLDLVPAEMVVNVETGENLLPKLIVPGS